MDFYTIKHRFPKKGVVEVYPDFLVGKSRDLMIRSKSFYAIWDEERRVWSTDEYDVARLMDEELIAYGNKLQLESEEVKIRIKTLTNFDSKVWTTFRTYLSHSPDNAHDLDTKLTFLNSNVRKTDYASKRLPYSLEEGSIAAYDELMSTLYLPEERAKLEWAIGSIVAGDSKEIQKFIVLFGAGGTGKSTFLNILQDLFVGYFTVFEAKELTSSSSSFATEAFKGNPLVAIQHDGDLSRIEDNTTLNSIVSHEFITINEKYKPKYQARSNCLLFMATNSPVKITNSNSGIIRRLIDVHPTGKTFKPSKYHNLMTQIKFEHGAIAYHCLKVYESMGKNYYSNYKPLDMIERTDVFFNFMETNYYTFVNQGGVTLTQAWNMYKEFCEDSALPHKMPKYKFKAELANYFRVFYKETRVNGEHLRSYYSDLLVDKFRELDPVKEASSVGWLVLDQSESLFDSLAANYPAQYATIDNEIPKDKWSKIKTVLSDIDTSQLHYVQVPEEHIVIDFDIRDENGNKSLERNLEEANKFPPTYGEFSKSQAGIHLHYIWDGNPKELSRIYAPGIEIKVFTGDSALRRKMSFCNSFGIATISDGLPLKDIKMINFSAVKSENGLRDLIKRNLRKEIHPGTKPSIDFIYKILEDAHASGMSYDVSDMAQSILAFAANSTNQSQYCVRLVSKMKFSSDEPSSYSDEYDDDRLVFFDTEVFPNLLIVNWKYAGEDSKPVHMINPGPQEIERLMKYRLVGFNNRRYDNHILYARYIGYDNEQLFELSKAIIDGSRKALFGEAYNISYADVYDFSSKKQGLKKFQLELGIHHRELPFAWDEPLAEEHWQEAIEYCDNDVISTEAVFNDRKQDFVARQILAELSGLSINDTTQMHTARIIFGKDPVPQESFVYTDLSKMFPGYTFDNGKSFYRGEEPGEGGYVYSEPGFYTNVSLLDVASMHPTSIRELNLFGSIYTKRYTDLMDARLAIKHKDFSLAKTMFGGVLEKYLKSKEDADDLAYALKIVINIVYGLTSASFSNKFRDPRNIDNIVAKRGALFMIDLKNAIQEKGFKVVHIKTDSIKVVDATEELFSFVYDFGKKYGYTFEHEATYSHFCIVNDAVYIAKNSKDKTWTAVGAEFAHPYIFKTLFSHEPIAFDDLCETKSVTTAMYLDMNEGLKEDEHNYVFVGRAGIFCPITPGNGGGILYRFKNDKYYAVTGTKGWRWLQSEIVRSLGKEDIIDKRYFQQLVDNAVSHIEAFVPFATLIN